MKSKPRCMKKKNGDYIASVDYPIKGMIWIGGENNGIDLTTIKKLYKWLGQAIAYLEAKGK